MSSDVRICMYVCMYVCICNMYTLMSGAPIDAICMYIQYICKFGTQYTHKDTFQIAFLYTSIHTYIQYIYKHIN